MADPPDASPRDRSAARGIRAAGRLSAIRSVSPDRRTRAVDVGQPDRETGTVEIAPTPQEQRLQRRWWGLGAALVALGMLAIGQALASPSAVSVAVVGLVALVALAAFVLGRAVRDVGLGRQREAESRARILRGLSRSVSPDAIVEAIVADLGEAAGADHTVVVRLRPEARLLDATLVSSRVGVPSSSTALPASELEEPGDDGPVGGAEPVAIPVESWSEEAEAVPGTGTPLIPPPRGRARPTRPYAPPVVDAAAATRIAARIAGRVGTVYGLRNTIAAPLRVDGAVVGAIVLSRRLPDPWSSTAVGLLAESAGEASAALSRAYSRRAAEARASTDALTGLPNRRYFEEFCGLLARRRRADDAVGVLMVDIDHFKKLNDRFGHPVGDIVLKAVADAIAGAVRDEDVPARFGGEEFAVLLRNPSPAVALDVGERIRSAVKALDLRALGPERLTVSVGVAMAGSADQPIADIVDQADRALYRAKRLGRDRVVAA